MISIVIVFTCVAGVWFLAGFMLSEALSMDHPAEEPRIAGHGVVTNGERRAKS